MTEYYFVGGLLQDLQLDVPPDMGWDELMDLFDLNLSKEDLEIVAVLRRIFDIYHLKALFKGAPFLGKGNLDENELEEAMLTGNGIPGYFSEYLDKYENSEERQKNFTELLSRYFNDEMASSTGFLQSLMKMERDARLILTALRAKKLKRDTVKEIQYEDPEDDLVATILAQKDAPVFDPPDEYIELKTLYEEHAESPLDLQKAYVEWKFNKILEMEGTDPFSMDKILGYTARLLLVEKGFELDENKGNELVDSIFVRAK